MLKAVVPAMRAADPNVKIIGGGLLLARPVPNPGEGNPQRFFEGMLIAGAAPHLDIVAYHAYPSWANLPLDFDLETGDWISRGGWTLGKARFLRQVMAAYGVTKPLIANETALGCNENSPVCQPPPEAFYQAQADYIVRTFVRARGEDISGLVWYTLNSPVWRHTGLLDENGVPRPAYWAYEQLASQLNRSVPEGKVDYGVGVEAYSFLRARDRVHVAWSLDYTADMISVPQSSYLAAYDRFGTALTPVAADPYYRFTAGFSPIYLILRK